MLKRILAATSTALAVTALSFGVGPASGSQARLLAAVDPQHTHPPASQPPQTTDTSQAPDMKKMHEQMMADMKAADRRLDQLVTEMNVAAGDDRVAAMARVVTELASQQKALHNRMVMMHEHMTGGRGMMTK